MSLIHEIENEFLKIGISSYGAELQYITSCDGIEFLWSGDENIWSGRAPLLFPICGGLKDDKYTYRGKEYILKKHGFAKFSEFSCCRSNNKTIKFTLKADEKTKEVYPFDFVLDVIYTIEENTLKVSYIIENLSDDEMYFSIGSHEAYACPEGIEEYFVEFDKEQTLDSFINRNGVLTDSYTKIAENTKTLPLKQEYFDNKSLIFKDIKFNKIALKHKNSNRKIVLEFEDAPYFLLWTLPHANYICLEPWHGITDNENTDYDISKKEGIIKLRGREIFTASHKVTFIK